MEVSSHISLKKAAKGSFEGGKTHERIFEAKFLKQKKRSISKQIMCVL